MTTKIVSMYTCHQKLMKVFIWSSFWKKFNSPGQMKSLQVFVSKRSWVETPSQFCRHFRDLVRTPEPQVRLQLDHSLHNVISLKNVIKMKIREKLNRNYPRLSNKINTIIHSSKYFTNITKAVLVWKEKKLHVSGENGHLWDLIDE